MHYRNLILPLLVATGCAYGYAGQEGKNRTKRPEADNVKVVSVEEDADKQNSNEPVEELPTEPVEPEGSPCGVETFVVEQYAPDALMRKTLDCRSRDLVNLERVPLSDSAFQRMKTSGLPVGKWYILVTPKSVKDGVLNNDNLLQMSREFELDYHGRESTEGRLVYLFLSPVP